MRGDALLWIPLGRVQAGRLPRGPSITRATARRLLWIAALVVSMGLAGSAPAGGGGRLAGQGLALARDLASAAAGLLISGPENACEPYGLSVPVPGRGDERLSMAQHRMIEPGCDDR